MKDANIKYSQNKIQLWIFKVALIFSVFAYTGYSGPVTKTANYTFNIELLESRAEQPLFSSQVFTSSDLIERVSVFESSALAFGSWSLYNYHQLITVKYKEAITQFISLQSCMTYFKTRIISVSGPDDFPLV